MEAGRADELTVLTPSDVRWIERTLQPRDAMARQILDQGKGRSTTCSHQAEEAGCGKAATHYTVEHGTGKMTGYCLEHWRTEADPGNVLRLDDTEESARTQEAARP